MNEEPKLTRYDRQVLANKKYREKNRDKYNEKARKSYYKLKDTEEFKAKKREQYLKRIQRLKAEGKPIITEKQKEYQKKYYQEHKEEYNKRQKEWIDKNKEKVRIARLKRYNEMRAAYLMFKKGEKQCD